VSAFVRGRLARVRDVLARHVEHGAAPGAVALLARGGSAEVLVCGDVSRDTIFRISSMTKPVTAVAAMICVEECLLRLDDPVDDLLPELARRRVLVRADGPLAETVPAVRAITVRDLLTFTFGLGLVFDAAPIGDALEALAQGIPRPALPPAPDEWMRRVGALPLMYQPGSRWLYNTGSDVLGVLIARASGVPFETFLADRLFGPLGMVDTGFFVPAGSLGRLRAELVTDFATGETVVFDEPSGQWSSPPAFPSGAGGLVSTIDDYAAFAGMLSRFGVFGRERLLSGASVALMTADQLSPSIKSVSGLLPGQFDDTGWGFGVSVVTRRTGVAKSVGTYGWDGGLGTSWFNDPASDLTAILMTQRAFSSPVPGAIFQDFWTTAQAAVSDLDFHGVPGRGVGRDGLEVVAEAFRAQGDQADGRGAPDPAVREFPADDDRGRVGVGQAVAVGQGEPLPPGVLDGGGRVG
jgi:CubicO group peptidase (beta-lactamase class C family)